MYGGSDGWGGRYYGKKKQKHFHDFKEEEEGEHYDSGFITARTLMMHRRGGGPGDNPEDAFPL